MAEKTNFHQLLESPPMAAQIAPDQKACANCAHGRQGDELPVLMRAQATSPDFVLCKRGPPSVVAVPAQAGLALASRWPAMAPEDDCDMFEPKTGWK